MRRAAGGKAALPRPIPRAFGSFLRPPRPLLCGAGLIAISQHQQPLVIALAGVPWGGWGWEISELGITGFSPIGGQKESLPGGISPKNAIDIIRLRSVSKEPVCPPNESLRTLGRAKVQNPVGSGEFHKSVESLQVGRQP